jgi:hypothetical protein
MSNHPTNMFVRLLMEVAAILMFGFWGYLHFDSWIRIVMTIGLPLLFAALWGVFAVRNDPSRSGKTVIQTPGLIRLMLELVLFGAATWMILDLGFLLVGKIYGGIVILHYIVSYDRVIWLVRQK